MNMEKASIALIGGSGLYQMAGLQNTTEHEIDTPFGKPSSPIVIGTLEGTRVAFLARHGIGHHITPTEVPYRANIYALKLLGAERIISISACGSLREDYAPGDIVIPDNIYDNTKDRVRSFFGNGFVAHVGVADPFCTDLSNDLEAAVRATNAKTHRGGTLITIEGPRFSTKAESNAFRAWGMSIIGMTASPEAFLAREAEICYATMAHVTDYDVWHESEEPVTVEMVIQTLNKNTQKAQEAIHNLIRGLKEQRNCKCGEALATALITNPKVIPAETRQNLDLLVGKYMK
ncbi:MAG TPA: S-methyl-5'-thioadenosine phosphorylase [Anaerolineales bacterium]|nr:S-methyl-5'-thioadenosine phosphorylase [Anaerolineales bacterium]HMX19780.1 S-methyl-5'-thioadenosine phosphorylase [Anaerolineales bacterium]HNA54875.1 S-methyl-5'-thioadenosine phosphorylase [Anaerolineales bacterium]HNC89741.1 S-methyl-5'-thioadenosine phosphorylase [Anaerolineales bacterium]HND92199.1 S-methyl-5'-thioadenosine phosphorylase [Anaerolineales bacterium]